jgi:methyl-accepting chemotaxis protein
MGFSIGAFVESNAYKKIMAKVYGWGAAVVLAGALFKIQHYPGASAMLIAGMGTEIVIFFMSAFEPLHEEYDWSLVYPELAGIEDEDQLDGRGGLDGTGTSSALEKFDALLEQGELSPELFERLGTGLQSLNGTTEKLSDLADATVATNDYVQNVKQASSSMTGFADTYNKSVKELTNANFEVKDKANGLADSYALLTTSLIKENDNAIEGNKTYGQQLDVMTKNLTALNAVYELQLDNSNSHIEASKKLYAGLDEMMQNLHDSVDDAKAYKEQISKLSTNLSAMNTVYGNMLNAMNVQQ